MKLFDLLREPLIKVGLEARTREDAIRELIDLLVAQGAIAATDRHRLQRAIFCREQAKSTGMEHGVALPHGAVDGLDEVAAALGIVKGEGIDFASADGRPADLIVLVAIPHNMLQFHVKTLSGIARLLNDERLRASLRAASSPAEAFAAIRAAEGE